MTTGNEACVVCGGSGMKPDGPLTIRCWSCNPEPKRKHGPMCSCMSCSQAHVQGLVAEAKAEARREALEEAAKAMHPMLRSMISRSEAARICRALAKEPCAHDWDDASVCKRCGEGAQAMTPTEETEIEAICRVAGPADPEAQGWLKAFKFLVATEANPDRKDISDYLIHLLRSGTLPPTPKQS